MGCCSARHFLIPLLTSSHPTRRSCFFVVNGTLVSIPDRNYFTIHICGAMNGRLVLGSTLGAGQQHTRHPAAERSSPRNTKLPGSGLQIWPRCWSPARLKASLLYNWPIYALKVDIVSRSHSDVLLYVRYPCLRGVVFGRTLGRHWKYHMETC